MKSLSRLLLIGLVLSSLAVDIVAQNGGEKGGKKDCSQACNANYKACAATSGRKAVPLSKLLTICWPQLKRCKLSCYVTKKEDKGPFTISTVIGLNSTNGTSAYLTLESTLPNVPLPTSNVGRVEIKVMKATGSGIQAVYKWDCVPIDSKGNIGKPFASAGLFLAQGLKRGQVVEVKVSDIKTKGKSASSVWASTQVVLLPDIQVQLTGPSEAQRLNGAALIRGLTYRLMESKGDVGTFATVTLSVTDPDGIPITKGVPGPTDAIYVDAGEVKDLILEDVKLSAAKLGNYTFTITVSGVLPAEWSTSNNAASTAVMTTPTQVGVQNTGSWLLRNFTIVDADCPRQYGFEYTAKAESHLPRADYTQQPFKSLNATLTYGGVRFQTSVTVENLSDETDQHQLYQATFGQHCARLGYYRFHPASQRSDYVYTWFNVQSYCGYPPSTNDLICYPLCESDMGVIVDTQLGGTVELSLTLADTRIDTKIVVDAVGPSYVCGNAFCNTYCENSYNATDVATVTKV